MCARKIVNAPKVEVHYGEKKRTLFGWCIDGHDKDCIKEFPGNQCSCECHAEFREDTELAQDVVEEDQ